MYSSLVLVVISGFLKNDYSINVKPPWTMLVTQASEMMTFGRKMNYFHKKMLQINQIKRRFF